MVGKASVQAAIRGDAFGVERDDFGGQAVVFRVLHALIDSNLEIEVGRLDPRRAIFAGVIKLPPLVAEEAADVGKELISGGFYIGMPRFTHKALSRVTMRVRHVVVLLVAAEPPDAPNGKADDAALILGGVDWWIRFDDAQVEA